jgi:hypothetical protein
MPSCLLIVMIIGFLTMLSMTIVYEISEFHFGQWYYLAQAITFTAFIWFTPAVILNDELVKHMRKEKNELNFTINFLQKAYIDKSTIGEDAMREI